MADNIAATPGTGVTLASDDIAGVHYPRVKLSWGADGAAVDASASNPIPVVQTGTPALPTDAATETSVAAAATSLAVMDDWDESDRAKVNIIAGQVGVEGGSGTVSALTQRVVLATDVALPAGTNAIGKLAANSGVDIGDVDVASIAAGSNTIGNTRDAGPSWTSAFGVTSAAVVSADLTTRTAVTDAPTSGQKLVITDIIVSSDTAMSILFEAETANTDIIKVFIPANGTIQVTPRGKIKLATADKKLMATASVAGNIAVTVVYYSEA